MKPKHPLWKTPRQVQIEYREQEKCENCGRRKPQSLRLCKPCLTKHNTATKAHKEALIEAGLCTQCGQQPLATMRLCRDCQDRHNDRTRISKQLKRKLKK
jgi:hypothetical protein